LFAVEYSVILAEEERKPAFWREVRSWIRERRFLSYIELGAIDILEVDSY
jgi:hypothetical protein